jgi:hypothetical protein
MITLFPSQGDFCVTARNLPLWKLPQEKPKERDKKADKQSSDKNRILMYKA